MSRDPALPDDPADTSTRPPMASPRTRLLAAGAIVLAGSMVLDGWLTSSSLIWFAWLAVGAVAGFVAGPARAVWVVILATLLVYPIAMLLGRTEPPAQPMPLFWGVLVLVGGMVMGAGFALGAIVAQRRVGWVAGITLIVGVLGFAVWVGFSGYFGSIEFVDALNGWEHCETPATRFGWEYEAINYDKADDARLAESSSNYKDCATQGEEAGSEVVTEDGIGIAGWYIPAGNGAGPTAPTIIVAPGWKSNKSEILKYAPFFHDRYNLVLVDLRNQGRSGGDQTTWGYLEKQDISAMIDWLEETKQPSWIGATGNSMGAATVLAAAADDPRIRALILDSMHADVLNTFADGIPNERNLPGLPTAWAVISISTARAGVDIPSVNPVGTITKMGDRPVLLIHGTNDILDTVDHAAKPNLAAAEAAGVPVTVHYCQDGGHGGLVDGCPDEWQAWVDEFLAAVPDMPAP